MASGGDDLQFTLLENGLHSIAVALEFMTRKSPDLKIAVLLLGQGIELLLKARLHAEHWTLIFEDPASASLEKVKSGEDYKTAGFQQCVERLESICGIAFEPSQRRSLTKLRTHRNRMEHFSISANTFAIEAESCKVLSFAIDFVRDELEPEGLATKEEELLAVLRKGVANLASIVKHRWHDIRKKVDAARDDGLFILPCPTCQEPAAVLSDDADGISCEFCHAGYAPNDAATALVQIPLQSMRPKDALMCEFGPYDCPECDSYTLISAGGIAADLPAYLCMNCAETWDELGRCDYCNKPIPLDDEIMTCSDCMSDKMGKD
jgi:hypothetical protein